MNLPEPISHGALAFFQKLLGPVGEASEILSDKIRFYRWQSAIATLEKAKAFAARKKIKPEEVPLKFFIPFLEAASLEDKESGLQDHWAHLLTGAIRDKRHAKSIFIDVLKGATTDEIRIIDGLVDKEFMTFLKAAPGVGEIPPAMLVNALTTMRRIQLADHVEKSVLYIIETYEADLSAEAEAVEDLLMALAGSTHSPVHIENIVVSDRGGTQSYGQESGSLKRRWKKTLSNKALLGANVDLISSRAELDALSSKGLLDRTFHTFDAYDGHGFFSLVCPTPLGVEFVCACRGDPLPYPKEKA